MNLGRATKGLTDHSTRDLDEPRATTAVCSRPGHGMAVAFSWFGREVESLCGVRGRAPLFSLLEPER